MSDDDKRAYRQLLLIAVLCIFAILFIVALGAAYAQYACIQFVFRKDALPSGCENGAMAKFVLEFLGIVVGTLGAIKLLGQ